MSTDHPMPAPRPLLDADPDDSVSVATPWQRYQTMVRRGEIASDPQQQAVAKQLDELASELAEWRPHSAPQQPRRWLGFLSRKQELSAFAPPPRSVYIHGAVGRGKSMLMDLFYASVGTSPRRRVHFHAFMAEIHQRLKSHRETAKEDGSDPFPRMAAEVAAASRLLCFDEFVVNNIADAMILARLVEHLLEAQVVIVATSNFAPVDLYKDGLHRDRFEPFIRLLGERFTIVPLDSATDYRRNRLSGRQVYHSPLGAYAERKMAEAWEELTDGAKGEATAITVLDRIVAVPCAAAGIARFHFKELCDRPLGASDYLALGATYHTLLIDEIPLLGPSNHNEARRFITLIDALYESRTKLVASMAAQPDRLYPEGIGAFEFTRTASRLMEMQSNDWLDQPPSVGGALGD